MARVNDLPPEDKCKRFGNIHTLFEKAKDYSDDKVQLAMQTYEMVDKHIRRLDSELAKLEAEMKDKQQHLATTASSSASSGIDEGGKNTVGIKKKKGQKDGKKVTPRSVFESKDQKRKKVVKESLVPEVIPTGIPLLGQTTEVLDMPVDPNEPTYCICHQVSYGEMIGCDNIDCSIEWFHFGCVGLTSKPKGKWFCPKCTSDRKKK